MRMAVLLVVAFSILCASCSLVFAGDLRDVARNFTPNFRPPSVPLVVVSPYFSVWSNNDHLYDDCPHHWSGPAVCLSGMIRIDGKVYRFMGNSSDLAQSHMKQVNLTVFPTHTVYVFQQDGIELTLLFTTPAYQLSLLYYPVTFLTYNVTSIDGRNHSVQFYYDNTAEGAVSNVSEDVVWSKEKSLGDFNYTIMKIGTKAQNYLGQTSDRINWGYWYVAVVNYPNVTTTMAYSTTARTAFINGKPLPPDDKDQPRPCNERWPVLAVVWDLGTVHPGVITPVYALPFILVLYDEVYSIKYFGTPMMPVWRSRWNGDVKRFLSDPHLYIYYYYNLVEFDRQIVSALHATGGSNYTTIASLAWRQTMGATVTVWDNVTRKGMTFIKDISNSGYVNSVDVMFSLLPLYLWGLDPLNSPLILQPIFTYANNATAQYGLDIPYNLSWTPHHLGHWPICDIPPNKQEQMPMEETGNMMIMLAYITKRRHDILDYLEPYWPLLDTWGKYLAASLPDPSDQLSADDFEGPSAHNVNLAAKGILGLAAYAYLLREDGRTAEADHYDGLNKQFVQFWLKNASDGDHYKRQYNNTNSWSLKYNLAFQKVLDFDLFPDSVFTTEENYYQKMMHEYGVPLDERADFTLAHWEMFVAGVADQQQFQIIVDKIYKYLNETPDRVPFSDWYDTTTGRQKGFSARPVVGGLFMRLFFKHPFPPYTSEWMDETISTLLK